MTTSLKRSAYNFCEAYLDSKLQRLQLEMDNIKEALQSETKSTAGDKHETGRAMLQLEREKLGRQLAEAEKMKRVFEKVAIQAASGKIGLGSLVKTDKASYYICISAGRFLVEGNAVFCISISTPIGKLLLGKSVGQTIVFNGITQEVLAIY